MRSHDVLIRGDHPLSRLRPLALADVLDDARVEIVLAA
jgi:hypothetical protein